MSHTQRSPSKTKVETRLTADEIAWLRWYQEQREQPSLAATLKLLIKHARQHSPLPQGTLDNTK